MATTKPLIRIHNTETNEIVDREMTDTEHAQYEAELAERAERDAQLAEAAAKREAVLAALAEAAGLEVDEVKSALGA